MKAFFALSLLIAVALAAQPIRVDPAPFSWSACGPASDPITVNSMTLTPYPVHIVDGSSITFSSDVTLNQDITSIAVNLLIEKQVTSTYYIKVPCIDNVGSCNYPDFCPLLAQNSTCPALFTLLGLPCQCPFAAGHYTVPATTENLNNLNIPSSAGMLLNGNFRVTAKFVSAAGAELGCLQIKVSLTNKN